MKDSRAIFGMEVGFLVVRYSPREGISFLKIFVVFFLSVCNPKAQALALKLEPKSKTIKP